MLRKLIKHEFRALNRIFIPVNVALLAIGLLGGILGLLLVGDLANAGPATSLVIVMMWFLFVMAMLAGIFIPVVVTILRFWKNLLGSEGYLMFTLPATRRDLIFSKLIPATTWFMLTILSIIIASLLAIWGVLLGGATYFQFIELRFLLEEIVRQFYWADIEIGNMVLFAVMSIMSTIFSIASGILMMYASMAIAQLSNQARIIIAIAVWVGLNFATTIAYFFGTIFGAYVFPALATNMLISTGIGILWYLVLCVVFFVITEQILSKRLNLQ